ncbi:hypothetical protein D3C86_1121610 [compost metagenome]
MATVSVPYSSKVNAGTVISRVFPPYVVTTEAAALNSPTTLGRVGTSAVAKLVIRPFASTVRVIVLFRVSYVPAVTPVAASTKLIGAG